MIKCKCGNYKYRYSKICQKCYVKTLKGKGNPNYKHGKTHHHRCIICGKSASNNSKKLYAECYHKNLGGKNNPAYGKISVRGKSLVRHHRNLNKKDNAPKNILILTHSKHTKLHQTAYRYLVLTGQVGKYINWFLKRRNL